MRLCEERLVVAAFITREFTACFDGFFFLG